MLDRLNHFDHSFFLALHHWRNGFFDFVMPLITNRWFWIPFYALLVLFIWKRFGKQTIMIILTMALLILAADQSANFLKNSIKRPRPCHDVTLVDQQVFTPEGCGGEYGFVSGHAANSAALALFLFLLSGRANGFPPSRDRKRWALLFPWCLIVCWSRIYVGVHFPFDVICGMLLGFLYAVMFFILYKKVLPVLR